MDYLDVSSHLELMDNKIMAFDKDARAVHIVISITMQNELSFVVANSQTDDNNSLATAKGVIKKG